MDQADNPKKQRFVPRPISNKITVTKIMSHPSTVLEIVPQPFTGPPISKKEAKPKAKEPKEPKLKEESKEELDPSKKLLTYIDPLNLHKRDFSQNTSGLAKSTRKLFTQYITKQQDIESNNPYITNTEIYTPQTRKSFYQFMNNNFKSFKLDYNVKGKIDPNACLKLETSSESEIEGFLYQKFIREYIQNASPYRGILVYHGLGSGKTCSAIAAAEALYGVSGKKIIVMTPFSLRANFMSEISFCGFKHFNVNNYWVATQISEIGDVVYMYATSILSLREEFLKKVMKREEDRQVIWIPDFSKKSNYNTLTATERDDIRAQLNETIDSRITFISYNGITAKKLKEYACKIDPDTGDRFFDNKTIVIDEIHNVTRLMRGNVLPYMVQRKGRPRKIKVEPVTPGKWVPGLCDTNQNYNRAYLLYKLLTDARNSKIIGLSGTPIINFPEELGILSNLLAGYTECIEVPLLSIDEKIIATFKQIVEKQSRVDIVRFKIVNQQRDVLISILNEGYERVADPEDANHFIGVRYNKNAQEGVREVYAKIKEELTRYPFIKVGEEKYVSYPRLPIDDETFRGEFIDPKTYTISKTNRLVLQKRITGLISYYSGSKQEYMPRILHDTIVKCNMSNYTLSQYTIVRKKEIEGEMKKETEKGDIFATVELLSTMKAPASYRFRSRALCNFTFPEEIPRPFPNSAEDIEEESSELLTEEEHQELLEVEKENELVDNPEMDAVDAVDADDGKSEPVRVDEDDGKSEAIPEKSAITAAITAMNNVLPALPALPAKSEGGVDPDETTIVDISDGWKPEDDIKTWIEDWLKADVNNVYIGPKKIDGKTIFKSSKWSNPMDEADGVFEEYTAFIQFKLDNPDKYPNLKEEIIALKGKKLGCWGLKNCHGHVLIEFINKLAPAPEPSLAPEPAVKKSTRKLTFAPELAPEPAVKKSTRKLTFAPELAPEPAIKKSTRKLTFASEPVKKSGLAGLAETVADALGVESKEPVQLASYKERLDKAMSKLDKNRELYMQLNPPQDSEGKFDKYKPLSEYSQKLHEMLTNINKSHGSNLVYSQFKTVEGLGVLGIALKTNGYVEIKIEGKEDAPVFSEETKASLAKGPDAKERRYITFTGEGSKERRNLILNIFNGNFDKLPTDMKNILEESGYTKHKNTLGDICWVIGITGAGAEGISLKCCRSVHIMEPYWNSVRLEQVKGRAIRICSHKDLPYDDRTVELYTYYTVFSELHRSENKIDRLIAERDKLETSDENVFNVSKRKDAINNNIIEIMKESAVDCSLNSADNNGVRCFIIEGRPDKYIFDPNLGVDKIITSMEFKQQGKVTDSKKEEVKVFSYKGVNYLSYLKPDSGGLVYLLYSEKDITFTTPLFQIDLSSGKMEGAVPIPIPQNAADA